MAAARDGTPSLVKMLLTCRSTVRSLRTSSAAMARLVSAGGDQAQHLDLPRGQPTARPGSRPGRPAPPAGPGRGRRRAVEGPAGGVQLHRRRVLVAEGAAGQPDQHPGPCRLVRRLQLPPGRPGAAQRDQGGRGVALGQQYGALGVGGRGPQQRRVQLGGGGVQLLGRRPGGRQVAGGQGDLDGGRQQPARSGRSVASSRTRRIAAWAAAACPWASRSRASPGWGSRPHRLARR